MARHVMVDLETWGTKPNAVIVAIGAVRFNPFGDITTDPPGSLDDQYGRDFRAAIDPVSASKFGEIDAETVMWWLDPKRDEARKHWLSLQKIDLPTALYAFSEWIGEDSKDDPICVWGNGAAFDNVILEQAFDKAGLPRPWMHWNDRCYRTIKNASTVLFPFPDEILQLGVIQHDALGDAFLQALHLQRILTGKHVGFDLR